MLSVRKVVEKNESCATVKGAIRNDVLPKEPRLTNEGNGVEYEYAMVD